MSEKFKGVKTHIDKIHSGYGQYAGDEDILGRVLHYITVVCGLNLGERVQVGEGSVVDAGVQIARYNWDKGYPDLTFENDDYNKVFKALIRGPEGALADQIAEISRLRSEIGYLQAAMATGWERLWVDCDQRELDWSEGLAKPHPLCTMDEVECDIDLCPKINKAREGK